VAKKSKGNQMQRRNVTPTVPNIHKNNNATTGKKEVPVDENPALQNAFTFTMAGMLLGALVGYFFNNLTFGFGIGILIGGTVDAVLNTKKKKKREAIEKENASNDAQTDQ